MSCLECRFHGPPVSAYTGPKPCAECIPHNGFPKEEPVEKKELPADVGNPRPSLPVLPEGEQVQAGAVSAS